MPSLEAQTENSPNASPPSFLPKTSAGLKSKVQSVVDVRVLGLNYMLYKMQALYRLSKITEPKRLNV